MPVPSAVSIGSSLPLSRVLLVGVIVLGSLLLAVVVVTIGYSLRAARRRRRRDPIRSGLRGELLDRLYGRDDPAWDEWVAGLSAAERDELESLLDVYLRELDGGDAASLAELGGALEIDTRSRRALVDGDYWERLHALVWLSLLQEPPDRDLLERHCTDTPRERAAAARVLYDAATDDRATAGVDLLLRGNVAAFSVFGVDTLYRVAEDDPLPFFERAAADFETWEPALQRQALLVVRHLTTVAGGADLSWVIAALSNPDPRVRSAAWGALGAYGWSRQVRDRIDLTAIGDDSDPTVRTRAYRALGLWGDADAITALEREYGVEPDPRARVAAAETLISQRSERGESPRRLPPDYDGVPPADAEPVAPDAEAVETAWRWAREHARFDRLARDISAERDRILREARG